MESEVMIRDVMTRDYVGVSESDTVLGVVQLMRDERSGSVVVLRGRDPVGIVTEWDVLELVADGKDAAETTVSDVMSTPVLSMEATRSVADAATTMAKETIRRIVVQDQGEVAGVLTERDIITTSASLSGDLREPESDQLDMSAEPSIETNGGTTEYASQGICEVCGSLTRELANFNGQIICTDCREV